MWDTAQTWITTNLTAILVPVVSGVVLVLVLNAPKIWPKKKTGPDNSSADAQLAKDLGVTEAALRNFFKILHEEHVGPDDLDAKLRDIAAKHKELLERVGAIPDTGENPDALRDEAQAAIADGRYDDADDILRRAEEQDVQSTARLEDELRTRHMAAAASALARGELAWTRFKYAAAAGHCLRAAERYPDDAIEERIRALNLTGHAYHEGAVFAPAEDAYTRARALAEAELTADDSLTAMVLNNLAQLYQATNRPKEAEPLMVRALAIDEAAFGPDHPNVARHLSNLARLYQDTNRLTDAEPLMVRALDIDEAAFGPDHPNVAIRLNNLATLYQATERLTDAVPLMERVVTMFEKAYGSEHLRVAVALNNLAQLYQDTDRLREAEPLMEQALAIDESAFGADHPKVAIRLNNLATLYQATNRLTDAESLMVRAIEILKKAYGSKHPQVAIALNNLGRLYQDTNRHTEAEPLFVQAVDILTRSLGTEHPNTKSATKNLAILRAEMGGGGGG